MPIPDRKDRDMWKASLIMACLQTAAGLIATTAFMSRAPDHIAGVVVLTLTGLLFSIVLGVTGPRTRAPISIAVFLLCSVTMLGTVWFNHLYYFSAKMFIEPYAGYKVYALAVGLIAPPILWTGFAGIVAAGLTPFIQTWLLAPESRHILPFQEPWLTALYAVLALTIYVYRRRWHETDLRSARVEARAGLLQEFAHLLINAQHLANTPLQTIENSVAILRAQHPDDKNLIEPMERALSRVREVVLLFSSCDSYIDWREIDMPTSTVEFDRRLKELIQKSGSSVPDAEAVSPKT